MQPDAFNPSGTTSACAAGTWDPDGNPFTPCVANTNCVPGGYVSNEGTTTSNRTCAACTSGRFSTVNNAPSCAAWTTCQAGTYVSNTPSSTVDRVCVACPNGQYSSGNNQSHCLDQATCVAGTVQTSAGTPTSPAVCTPCVAGQYCAGGTSPQTISSTPRGMPGVPWTRTRREDVEVSQSATAEPAGGCHRDVGHAVAIEVTT